MATPACPVCAQLGTIYSQARDIEYFSTIEAFNYYLCTNCDLLYIHPVLSDRLSQIYPANYYSFVESSNKNIVIRIKGWLDARAFRAFLRQIPGDDLKVFLKARRRANRA